MTCAECRDTRGWVEDPETGLPVDRCPCDPRAVHPQEGAAALRTAPDSGRHAQEAGEAHPRALIAALHIIEDAARLYPSLSSNSVRDNMRAAQVPGPVVGAAFRLAIKRGWLRSVALEASTDSGTHGHRVLTYQSLLCDSEVA